MILVWSSIFFVSVFSSSLIYIVPCNDGSSFESNKDSGSGRGGGESDSNDVMTTIRL